MHRHVTDAGLKLMNGTDLASRAEVVVVSGTDDVHYSDLRDATLAVGRGAEFLATGRDPTLPMPDGHWPGTGAILAAVETAIGPHGRDRRQALARACSRRRSTGWATARTLVIGDRLDSDIAAAAAAGLDGALVLSGGGPSEPRSRTAPSR